MTRAGTNRLFIYGLSDAGLNDGSVWIISASAPAQILPDAVDRAANGYDTIFVTDTATTVNGFIPVLYNTTDFAQATPDMDRAIIINAGFEANPVNTPGIDVADDITLTPSAQLPDPDQRWRPRSGYDRHCAAGWRSTERDQPVQRDRHLQRQVERRRT